MTWQLSVVTKSIKKLNVKTRLLNQTIAEPLVDPETGEILVEAGTVMDS